MFQILCAVVMASMVSASSSFAQELDLEQIGRELSASVKALGSEELDLEQIGRELSASVKALGSESYSSPLSMESATHCCPVDANGDCNTDGADLSVVLGRFGEAVDPGNPADLNGDSLVNGADLSVLLFAFGCPGSTEEPAPPVCP